MSKYRHCYPAKCPKCNSDLTADNEVVMHFIVAGQPSEVASRLDQNGWLVDVDNVIAHGHHSGTDCRRCGEGIDGCEILGASADKPERKNAPRKTRPVEYYRLWGGDSGTWDTDFVEVPAETPDDQIEEAVQKAVAKIKWREESPVIVGVYCAPDPEEEDDALDSGNAETDMDEEYGDEDHCPASPCGSHSPEWSSVSLAAGAGDGILDVACQHCGRSGSFAINNEDINW